MLSCNAGLKSRFTEFFKFSDWDSEDCTLFFKSLTEKNKFSPGLGEIDILNAKILILGMVEMSKGFLCKV